MILLFVIFAAAMIALVLRLGRLQFAEADRWNREAQSFIHRHYPIETSRGTIRDRRGVPVAHDVPCWDLAIDYRALNQEDRWLTSIAVRRMRDVMKIGERSERVRRLPEVKLQIADTLDRAPVELGRLCSVPAEEMLSRYNEIRRRVQLLRHDRWGQRFDRRTPGPSLDKEPDEIIREERSVHTLVHNLPDKIALGLKQLLDEDPAKSAYPGLFIVDARRREYPFGPVAAHVIGTLRPVDKYDFALRFGEMPGSRTLAPQFDMPDLVDPDKHDSGNLWGYLPGDDIGGTGAEAAFENLLRGTRGARAMERGQPDPVKSVEPIPGKDVRLTIDAALQRDLTAALMDPARNLRQGRKTADELDGIEHPVAVVVLNIADGQVLSMVSVPTYDLNTWDADKGRLIKDARLAPLLNRAMTSYPPGSTIKPIVAVAALSENVVTPESDVFCRGYYFENRPHMFRCLGIHNHISMSRALEKSCNVYFYTMGDRLGLERESKWYSAMGLGAATGIEIRPESRGELPNLAEVRARGPNAEKTEAIQQGIGQGELWASPLQMANAYATILRGGELVAPRLVVDSPATVLKRTPLNPQHIAAVRDALQLVTASGGTARSLKLKLGTAGKTGSATAFRPAWTEDGQPVYKPLLDRNGNPVLDADGKPQPRPRTDRAGNPLRDTDGSILYQQDSVEGTDAWFIGYAPADKPQFVIATLMEFGGHGGWAATPIFKETILTLQRHGYLEKLDVTDTKGH